MHGGKNSLWCCSLESGFHLFCDHMSMAFCGVSKYGVLLQVLVDTRLFGIVHVDLVYSIVE